MKKVSKFETTDGRLWDTENEAKNHQDVVTIAQLVQTEVPTVDPISRSKLVHFLINNVDPIMGIVRSRRARQARFAKATPPRKAIPGDETAHYRGA
jgi:hypothetical protein